jgi:hypothetical protein
MCLPLALSPSFLFSLSPANLSDLRQTRPVDWRIELITLGKARQWVYMR